MNDNDDLLIMYADDGNADVCILMMMYGDEYDDDAVWCMLYDVCIMSMMYADDDVWCTMMMYDYVCMYDVWCMMCVCWWCMYVDENVWWLWWWCMMDDDDVWLCMMMIMYDEDDDDVWCMVIDVWRIIYVWWW